MGESVRAIKSENETMKMTTAREEGCDETKEEEHPFQFFCHGSGHTN
jgi:hypothetical protein